MVIGGLTAVLLLRGRGEEAGPSPSESLPHGHRRSQRGPASSKHVLEGEATPPGRHGRRALGLSVLTRRRPAQSSPPISSAPGAAARDRPRASETAGTGRAHHAAWASGPTTATTTSILAASDTALGVAL